MQLGAKHVESPFIAMGQISALGYFLYFTLLMYGVTLFENSLVEMGLKVSTRKNN
jgi:ubiquinol-cytochrome c reductase cytochrome b subunit